MTARLSRWVCVFLTVLGVVRANELIPAGDFEKEAEGEIPAEWQVQGASSGEARVIKESGPSGGEKVLLLEGRERVSASVTTGKIPFDRDKPLIISGWMKASGVQETAPGGYVMLTFFDEGHAPLGRDSNSAERTSRNLFVYNGEDWKEFRREFVPEAQFSPGGVSGQLPIPADAAFFELKMTTLGYPANLWFDGLSATQD